jgi:hypothetical protein
MSYSEENGQVVLRMSREDYNVIMMALGVFTAPVLAGQIGNRLNDVLKFLNRLNDGNPNYTPYQVPSPSKYSRLSDFS